MKSTVQLTQVPSLGLQTLCRWPDAAKEAATYTHGLETHARYADNLSKAGGRSSRVPSSESTPGATVSHRARLRAGGSRLTQQAMPIWCTSRYNKTVYEFTKRS